MSKILLIFLFGAIYLGCANSKASHPSTNILDGAKIYKMNCTLCHGSNGKLGANGSKDLTQSAYSLEDRISIITNGKGSMAPYKGILNEEEIKAVAKFTLTLK